MCTGDARKAYWDEKYMDYWKSRVEEAGVGKSDVVQGDCRIEDDSVYENVFAKYGFKPGAILDVGCAWGRMFPLFHKFNLDVAGVDISTAMITAAEQQWSAHPNVSSLKEATAEFLPYKDSSFDNLACLAVFDATFQDQSIREFLRVTRPGAIIYLTGKNTNYEMEDKEALAAEKRARGKGHPNYFTHTAEMIELLLAQGHKILGCYLFPRRGDFSAFNYHTDVKKPFYEYLLIVERGDGFSQFPKISDEYSETFRKVADE